MHSVILKNYKLTGWRVFFSKISVMGITRSIYADKQMRICSPSRTTNEFLQWISLMLLTCNHLL